MILFMTAIADKGGFIQQVTVVRSWDKVGTYAVTVRAGMAQLLAGRPAVTADLFSFAVPEQGTFVGKFIKGIVTIQSAMLFDFLRDGGRVFSNTFSNLSQGGPGIQTFLNRYPVILCHVFMVSRYRL